MGKCKFEIEGCCYAYICYSSIKCGAKDTNGNVVCMATIDEIKKLNVDTVSEAEARSERN